MSGLLPHFRMPWMAHLDREISDCEELGYVAAISGAAGSGKTRLCTHLQKIRKHRPGAAHYYLLNPVNSPLVALQAVSDSIQSQVLASTSTEKGTTTTASSKQPPVPRDLGTVTRAMVEKIKAANISLLILDRVDRVGSEFLPAVFQVLEMLRVTDHRFGLVITADHPPERWLHRGNGYLTFVYHYFHIEPLSPITCGALLDKWCEGAAELAAGLRKGDLAAHKLANSIHGVTRGNFRELEQFAHRKNRYHPFKSFSPELIKELQGELPPRFEMVRPMKQSEFNFQSADILVGR